MEGKADSRDIHQPEMTETTLGPSGAGLPEIPEPSGWDTAYGIDEAVAIAVVPERALIFWELASMISAGKAEGAEFRLIRLHLTGEIPKREDFWTVGAIGRFQDSGVQPGEQYLYVLARMIDNDEVPLMVTNPVRMPVRHVPGVPIDVPTSLDLTRMVMERALKEGGGK
jgi:hypothetical protein